MHNPGAKMTAACRRKQIENLIWQLERNVFTKKLSQKVLTHSKFSKSNIVDKNQIKITLKTCFLVKGCTFMPPFKCCSI